MDYTRCKATHRCNMAASQYDVAQSTYAFTVQAFKGGAVRPADLFLDFEDWRSGTGGLTLDPAFLDGHPVSTSGAHFSPFDAPSLGRLSLNVTGAVVEFDTEAVQLRVRLPQDYTAHPAADCAHPLSTCGAALPFAVRRPNASWDWELPAPLRSATVNGTVLATEAGTEVATFVFSELFLGSQVQLRVRGTRPIAWLSRSSLVLDTVLAPAPGTVGGYQGGGAVMPFQVGDTLHGPASGAQTVAQATIEVGADALPEVQRLTAHVLPGQTLRGNFSLLSQGLRTQPIPIDAHPAQVQARIQADLPHLGRVHVARSAGGVTSGYEWNITMTTGVGNVAQLGIDDSLVMGVQSSVTIDTIRQGNELGGTFALTWRNVTSPPIPARAPAADVQRTLASAWGDAGAVFVHVMRTADDANAGIACAAGLCARDQPAQSGGVRYTVTLGSPAVARAGSRLAAAQLSRVSANATGLTGLGAFVSVSDGHPDTQLLGMPAHAFMDQAAYMLAFGGHGGGSGGSGGWGHAAFAPYRVPRDAGVPDLLGGSGGAAGGEIPQQMLWKAANASAAQYRVGMGGAGGCAMELIAVNDVVITARGWVSAAGEPGYDGWRAGGGGGGGTVVLAAGGVIVLDGRVQADGGAGGAGRGAGSRGGGGGGGGRVTMFAQAVVSAEGSSAVGAAAYRARGGAPGLDNAAGAASAVSATRYFSGLQRTAAVAAGEAGLVAAISSGGARYAVDPLMGGAQRTQRSLRVSVDEGMTTDAGQRVRAPYHHNGPSFTLPANESGVAWLRRGAGVGLLNASAAGGSGVDGEHNAGSQPARVTAYLALGKFAHGGVESNWGPQIVLHGTDYRPAPYNPAQPDGNVATGASGAAGPGGPAAAGGVGVAADGGQGPEPGADADAMVGVAVVNGMWRHDANYRGVPGVLSHPADPGSHVPLPAAAHQWYKVDLLLNWANHTYTLRVDDVTLALDQPFAGSAVKRIGLYMFGGGTAWFDEVYAGEEYLAGFECPISVGANTTDLRMARPIQSGWQAVRDLRQNSSLDNTSFHDSHVSQRPRYQHSYHGGLDYNDGEPHAWFSSALKQRHSTGDHPAEFGSVWAGALTFVPGSAPGSTLRVKAASLGGAQGAWSDGASAAAGTGLTGRWYWYGEHDAKLLGQYFDGVPVHLAGGVAACSTDDFVSWRNEGLVLHYVNLTDDVYRGQHADYAASGVHEVHARPDTHRMTYANALDPYWSKVLYHGGVMNRPAYWRDQQGVIWNPLHDMVHATKGSSYLPSDFRNSTISCSSGLPTVLAARYADAGVAALCGVRMADSVRSGADSRTVPDMCHWEQGTNHTGLGLPTPERVLPHGPGGARLIYGTVYVAHSVLWASGAAPPGMPAPTFLAAFVEAAPRVYVWNATIHVLSPQGSVSAELPAAEAWRFPAQLAAAATHGWRFVGGYTFSLDCPRAKRFFLRAERPRVVYNAGSGKHVMWMSVDDTYQTRRLAGVALADAPSGPFTFLHSVLPDGNETTDFSVLQAQQLPSSGAARPAYLVRTYYATTAYFLPLPIMQPIWQSVLTQAGDIDFRLNFQRALYDAGYDNPDDIWRQRWRMEDVPWRITTGDWVETWDQATQTFTLKNDVIHESHTYQAAGRALILATTLKQHDLRVITGQARKVVTSRFINPDEPSNSYWSQSSVPAVKAQPWAQNYEDKNVVDNPMHPTVADLLIGPHRPVQYRRAKYVAVSLLSADYTNTTGILRVVEGELTDDLDVIALVSDSELLGRPQAAAAAAAAEVSAAMPFGLHPGAEQASTFPRDVTARTAERFTFDVIADWYDRHHQYSKDYNDRADDFRNFRDRQHSSACPELHHRAMAQQTRCEQILSQELRYEDSPAMYNNKLQLQSFARAMDTSAYEQCLATHKSLLEQFAACTAAQVPDMDNLGQWEPSHRACVGGGGPCGPATQMGQSDSGGFVDEFTHSRQYGSMTNVYEDGGKPYNTAPQSRTHAFSRPPPLKPPVPKAQQDRAYPRNVPW